MYSYRIEKAIRAAAILHREQVRKGASSIPYITHLAAVAWLVRDYSNVEDTIISAWLHDTIEDTDYTAQELEEDFGYEVRKIVEALSEPKEKDGVKLSIAERKNAYIEQIKKAPESVLIISAADKIHNLRTIVEQYHSNHEDFIQDFPSALNETDIFYQNLSNVLNRRLNNDILAEFNHVYTEYKNFLAHVKTKQTK